MFVLFSKIINETKNNIIIEAIETNPTIPSLIPPFMPLPTSASKQPTIQEIMYFTILI